MRLFEIELAIAWAAADQVIEGGRWSPWNFGRARDEAAKRPIRAGRVRGGSEKGERSNPSPQHGRGLLSQIPDRAIACVAGTVIRQQRRWLECLL